MTQSFKILSLDGGGIRGAFSAGFLARVEELAAKTLTESFDLIAGTSTGAIIAAAIACNIPAKTIQSLYEKNGARIFERKWFTSRLLKAKYSRDQLEKSLQEVFGERTLEDTECRLLIPAVNLTGQPNVVFKTPHQPNFTRDRVRKIVDVLLAATAAPSYFPQVQLNDGLYADGGLWANNPSVAAYTEAVKIHSLTKNNFKEPNFDLKDIRILSVGTGKASNFMTPGRHASGLLWWGTNLKLLDIMGRSQSAGNHFQATYLLGKNYKRIDFDIPENEKWDLDSVLRLDQLIKEGQTAAVREVEQIKTMFLSDGKMGYDPFPVDTELSTSRKES